MGGCVSSSAGGGERGGPETSVRGGSTGRRGATEALPEPWESTIRRGTGACAPLRRRAARRNPFCCRKHTPTKEAPLRARPAGYTTETEDTTVRAAMRYSLDDGEKAKFAAAQVCWRAAHPA